MENDAHKSFGFELTKEEEEYATSLRAAIIRSSALSMSQKIAEGQEMEKYAAFGWGIAATFIGQIISLKRRVAALEAKLSQ